MPDRGGNEKKLNIQAVKREVVTTSYSLSVKCIFSKITDAKDNDMHNLLYH